VKLAGRLPKESADNGLELMSRALVEDTDMRLLAVVELEVIRVTKDLEHGGEFPTVAVVRVEACHDLASRDRALALLDQLAETRTGRPAAMFDLPRVVD
jgi:hypothetical protein